MAPRRLLVVVQSDYMAPGGCSWLCKAIIWPRRQFAVVQGDCHGTKAAPRGCAKRLYVRRRQFARSSEEITWLPSRSLRWYKGIVRAPRRRLAVVQDD